MRLTKMTTNGPVPMTKDEEAAFKKEQKAMEADARAEATKRRAKEELSASDRVAVRCCKVGVPYPQEWQDYDQELRVIAEQGTGEMPERPQYPRGT